MSMNQPIKIVTVLVMNLAVAPSLCRNASAQDVHQRAIPQRLTSVAMVHLPATLEEAVQRFPAAVVIEIEGFGPLQLRPATSTKGVVGGERGFATYRVKIVDVLYNKLGSSAPPLVAGQRVNMTQVVERDEADLFVTQKTRVNAKDQCIAYLWHSPGAPEWSLLSWAHQFRRSRTNDRYAETVLSNQEVKWLSGRQLAVVEEEGRLTVDWALLKEEIRRAGTPKQ